MDTAPQANPILAELHDADVAKLVSGGEVRTLAKGEEIIREGVMTPSLFVLLSGSLEVFAGSPMKHLSDLYPGELVGEMSFVDARVSSAIVRARETSEVLAISRAHIEQLMTSDPAMGARFYRGIARLVVRRLRTTIRHLGYGEKPQPRAEVVLDRRLLAQLSARRKAMA